MEIIECIQNTEEWLAAKLGVVSASNFSKVLNKKAGRGLYMYKLAAERLTGLQENGYYDKNMKAGNEIEAAARDYYALVNDCTVDEVGFVKRDEDVGCSPDGLLGTCGSIEIKCPLSSTHIANIVKDKMPPEYKPQVQGMLWV
ncbi:YqaJ viral recombinase family protein, partial [Candidatus Pacearchaeota archaeon]|nr:YqaJ viral recombinase family protein [Candidatus Pacearchaeota archaeon]